jgi:hypothetical protein
MSFDNQKRENFNLFRFGIRKIGVGEDGEEARE